MQGLQGVQGQQGLGAIPGPGLIWSDPDTLKQWVIIAKKVEFSAVTCTAGFSLPTKFETLPAKFHAYFAAFEATLPAGAAMWTSNLGRYVVTLDNQVILDSNTNSQYLYICHN